MKFTFDHMTKMWWNHLIWARLKSSYILYLGDLTRRVRFRLMSSSTVTAIPLQIRVINFSKHFINCSWQTNSKMYSGFFSFATKVTIELVWNTQMRIEEQTWSNSPITYYFRRINIPRQHGVLSKITLDSQCSVSVCQQESALDKMENTSLSAHI